MGRRKVELKKIEDKSSRQVTFSKRRSGLIKKAGELSVLCDVEVALVIFSNRGRLYEFCSTNSLTNILERYQSHLEEEEASKNEAQTQLMLQSVTGLHEQQRMLREENELLEKQIAEIENNEDDTDLPMVEAERTFDKVVLGFRESTNNVVRPTPRGAMLHLL